MTYLGKKKKVIGCDGDFFPADKSCLFPTAWWSHSSPTVLTLIYANHDCVRNPLVRFAVCKVSHYCQISDWTIPSDSAEFAQAPHIITMIALRVGGTSDLILVKLEF